MEEKDRTPERPGHRAVWACPNDGCTVTCECGFTFAAGGWEQHQGATPAPAPVPKSAAARAATLVRARGAKLTPGTARARELNREAFASLWQHPAGVAVETPGLGGILEQLFTGKPQRTVTLFHYVYLN
jgi:hypothetical protein